MRTSRLSPHRRTAWYCASFTFGPFLIWFGYEKQLFANPETRTFEISVFALAWLIVVVLLRLWARDAKELDK